MMSGDFQLKLRKCNRKLRVYAGNDDTKPAGIFHISDPETPLCGIDKNFVPEHPTYDELSGRILKGGWKRALRILIAGGYVERRRAERVFGSQIIGARQPPYFGAAQKAVDKEINAAYMRGFNKNGKPAMTRADVMDIASEIKKC